MKTLLFGGTGWLGHSIALAFAREGLEATICSRGRKNTFADDVKGLDTIVADKQDESAVKDLLGSGKYNCIIDTVPTEKSIALIAKHAKNLEHYIHCSSTGGYTPLPFVPCDETAPYRGFEPGSGWEQKAIVDNLVMKLNREQGFPATVIRPSYITGPGMLPLDNLGGRREDFLADVIAGKPLDLPDNGLALLHPVHVLDLAESFLLAAERPGRSIGQIYNVCLDHALTLNRYLELTAAAFGKKPVIHYMTVPDMLEKYGKNIDATGLRFLAQHMCFTNAKARRDLDYRPRHTTEDAVIETARWGASL